MVPFHSYGTLAHPVSEDKHQLSSRADFNLLAHTFLGGRTTGDKSCRYHLRPAPAVNKAGASRFGSQFRPSLKGLADHARPYS
jgi:hypothetical protein